MRIPLGSIALEGEASKTKTKKESNNMKQAVSITNAKDALALVAKTADKIVVRSANKERNLKAKYASFSDGVLLGQSGRILSAKRFEEEYGKRMTADCVTAVYDAMQGRMNTLGVDALRRTAEGVEKGKRKVTRIFANLSNGRQVIETTTTSKVADIEAVVLETSVNGKAVVDAKVAEAIARNLARHNLA